MNWLDRGIGWAFPSWGLRRELARAALRFATRAYEGGRVTRRTSGWTTASTSATAEIVPSIATLRNRSRDLVRNNPYGKRAIAKLVSSAIGTGIMAGPAAPADKVWKEWCDEADYEGQLDFYGLQTLIARTVFESGECLVRRIREDGRYAGAVPLKLQVLEPDYIDNTRWGPLAGGNYLIAGVEVDPQGRKVAYWLWDRHPGEYLILPHSLQSHRVPAAELLHIYEKERPGQLRGAPRLAVSMIKLRDLDEYEEAELVRKKIEACFAAFVRTTDQGRALADAVTTTDSTTGKVTRTETLSPGMIEYLKPNEEVTFGAPSSASGYADYTATQLHAIAVGAGVTYEQLTGDFSRVNYSSARAAMLEYRELVELFRWVYFIPMACRPIFDWFVDAAWTAGKLRTDSYDVVWTPPRWEYVDPLKDAQAEKLETISGFKPLYEVLRARGYADPSAVIAAYKKERDEIAAAGLTFDSSAIRPQAVDSAPGAGDPNADPNAATNNSADDAVVREILERVFPVKP